MELCLLAFKNRPGVWFLARRVLNSITAAILVYVVIDATVTLFRPASSSPVSVP